MQVLTHAPIKCLACLCSLGCNTIAQPPSLCFSRSPMDRSLGSGRSYPRLLCSWLSCPMGWCHQAAPAPSRLSVGDLLWVPAFHKPSSEGKVGDQAGPGSPKGSLQPIPCAFPQCSGQSESASWRCGPSASGSGTSSRLCEICFGAMLSSSRKPMLSAWS